MIHLSPFYFFFFFNDTATTEIYTLSLHDALPIYFASCIDFQNSAIFGFPTEVLIAATTSSNGLAEITVNRSISTFLIIRTPFSSCPAWYPSEQAVPGKTDLCSSPSDKRPCRFMGRRF